MKYTYIWSNLCSTIKYWFKPQQKWLIDEIPNTWCDKTELIKRLLFKMLEHYVEEEHGLQDKEDWTTHEHVSQDYIDQVKKVDGSLREVYQYIKVRRPKLEKQLEDAYPKIEHAGVKCWRVVEFFKVLNDTPALKKEREDNIRKAYARVDHIEKLIIELDEWALTTIVKNRFSMWT